MDPRTRRAEEAAMSRPAHKLPEPILDPREARRAIRAEHITEHTAGLAPQHVQGNLCILPLEYAAEFAAFCQRNPKPCPLIGMSAPGDPRIPDLGEDLDIRTDLPRYRVFRDGECVDEPTSLTQVWRDDLVSFVLGCSFSFELPMVEAGIRLRHLDNGTNVAMYTTNIACTPAGRFHGPTVVSMRPLTPANAIRAVQVTARYPNVHGAPLHLGFPEQIGIRDILRPDYGPVPEIREGELPVFWACGVTPQEIVRRAKPSLCITHLPGSMLITDRLNRDLAPW
jgi:uncharacterized protein YcsI (UPF0317 family)